MGAVERDADETGAENVPFAYIYGRGRDHSRIWAVIAAPSSQHEAIREAVRSVESRKDAVNLPSLIAAFKGRITRAGSGHVPADVQEAFQLLYSGGEAEQPSLDLDT